MYSTNSNSVFFKRNMLTLVDYDGESIPDISGEDLIELVDSLTVYRRHVYIQGQVFTTLCYQEYNTTSLDWLVLYYNGFFSALDLSPGKEIRFPLLSQIKAAKAKIYLPIAERVQI